MVKLSHFAIVAMLAAAPAGAQTVKTFNTIGSAGVNGSFGNSLGFFAANDSTLQLKVTGWQSNQSTNAIRSAYLGAYGGGLGVTGGDDQSGANNLHQIDNVGGFTDFLLLQFNRAVSLSGVNLNLYQLSGVSGVDSDLAYFNASILKPAQWNAAIDLSSYLTVPSLATEVAGDGASGSRSFGANAPSNYWLIGASFLPTGDRDDGFKLRQISVTEQAAAVPEPATWAAMMLGFGAIGAALRRAARRSRKALGATLRLA